jgi:general secretion pathway protein D
MDMSLRITTALLALATALAHGPAGAQQLPTPIRTTPPKAVQPHEAGPATPERALKAKRPSAQELQKAAQAQAQSQANQPPASLAPTLPAPGANPGPNPAPLPTADSPAGAPVLPVLPGAAGGAKVKFDPKDLEKADVEDAIRNKTVQDSITFKTNFEKEAKCVKLPLDMKINLDMQEAELGDLVKFFSCVMEKNFLLAGGVPKGKNITILATKPVTVYEAWKAFLSALEANGLTLVESGDFIKIQEIGKSKSQNIPLLDDAKKVPDDDSVMTVLIPLENIEAQEVEPILSKFKSAYGDLTIYAPTNTIFMTDNGTTIRRIMKILKELDIPVGKERIWIRQVEYAEAADIAGKIQEVFGKEGGKGGGAAGRNQPNRPQPAAVKQPGQPEVAMGVTTMVGEGNLGSVSASKILADERTNQLIIVANRSSYMRIDKLIRKLDVPIEGEGAIHIYYLENADAEEVSGTLSSLVGGGSGKGSGKGGGGKGGGGSAPKKGGGGGGGGVASLLEGDVKITADKGTNSLVIQSSLKDYMNVRKIIQKLDIRRKQVYVEAVIMEITTSKERKLGMSGSGGHVFDIDGNQVPLLLGLGGLGISGLNTQQLTKGGLAMGMQGPLVDVSAGSTGSASALSGTLSIPQYGFLLQAIQSNSDVNVLSTPHILTLDNEEAEIQVGKQIPYQANNMGGLGGLSSMMGLAGGLGGLTSGLTGSSRYGTGTSGYGGYNPYGSLLGGFGGMGMGMGMVQRIDVDLSLKITPQVNESNTVKLKIEQSIEDVEAMDVNLGPTTSKRKVNNTVVVRDQQPVVIGGLIRDTQSEGVDKIPVLGDIPVLGIMFRKTVTRTEKKNLLMVITPYIIDDPSDLKRIHEQKNEEMQKYMELMSTRSDEYQYDTDYRKKHGALEEINQTVNQSRKDRELQERMLFEESRTDTVGPAETHDIDYDPAAPRPDDRSRTPGDNVIHLDADDPVPAPRAPGDAGPLEPLPPAGGTR